MREQNKLVTFFINYIKNVHGMMQLIIKPESVRIVITKYVIESNKMIFSKSD